MGNPKTLTPGPRTLTKDRVRGLPTDPSMDYPNGPLYGPPAK